MSEGIRLQKYLSRAGRASRRESERLMAEGRVAVNGVVTTELGVRVVPGVDSIAVDGDTIVWSDVRWVVLHKPPGVLTTRSDPHGGTTVYDILPAELGQLRYVGRLDRDTEGVLLLTNDGDALHGLLHPSRGVERSYEVVLGGEVAQATLEQLRRGVELEDGMAQVKSVKVHRRGERSTTLRLVLTEGRKREVRRMMRAIDHSVRQLTRVSFGPVALGDLKRGEWREVTPAEKNLLLAQASLT